MGWTDVAEKKAVVTIDDSRRREAVERLVSLAGMSQESAAGVVQAWLQAGIDEAFELTLGAGSVPSSLTAAHAERLQHACRNAGRILTQREVEVLFRAKSASARSILTTMRASYEPALREQFLAAMRNDAVVRASGTEDAGLTWQIRFSESSLHEIAWAEVVRLGYRDVAEDNISRKTITFPRAIRGEDPLKQLSIESPQTDE